MKKWILIGLAIIIIVIWQSVDVYQSAKAEKVNGNETARQKVMGTYSISKIHHITFYHGQKDYHVIDATLQDGRHVFIWVPDKDKDGQFLMLPVSDGYSKSEILNAFKSHVSYKRIVSTRLGVEDSTPAWEITYIDSDGSYVFSYYNFETGEKIIDPISIQ